MQMERRASNRHHVTRCCGINSSMAIVSRGSEESYVISHEMAVVRDFTRALKSAES